MHKIILYYSGLWLFFF